MKAQTPPQHTPQIWTPHKGRTTPRDLTPQLWTPQRVGRPPEIGVVAGSEHFWKYQQAEDEYQAPPQGTFPCDPTGGWWQDPIFS